MRGTALVLTVAFVFASTTVLLGHASGQESDARAPEDCCAQQPPDATLAGRVLDGAGKPLAGASVSVHSYGPYHGREPAPEPEPAPASGNETSAGSGGGSGEGNSSASTGTASGSSIAYPCCYYGGGYNSTVTDGEGRYSLGVWSGDLQVSVHREGFAAANAQVRVESGQAATQDFTLKAFPAKTAHLVGKIADAKSGQGLGFATLSIRSPVYGLYECSWTDADRAANGASGGGSGGSVDGSAPAKESGDVASMPYPYGHGCAITVHEDGTFEGDVTPGYSIVSVHAWQDCSVSRDADGSSSSSCGPEHLGWTRTLDLPANETTRLDVKLPSRAAPDATVSGYLVDAGTGQAIPGATISFSNQETYAYGSATTDEDGSYRLRLRSGYHAVSVHAPGYLSWEGVLQVPRAETPFDVKLTPGQDAWGGCCYYAMDKAESAPAAGVGGSRGGTAASMATGSNEAAASGADGDGEQYQDLGGGLGPYNAADRQQALQQGDGSGQEPADGRGAPGAGLLLTLAALGAVLVALRRRMS